MVHTILESINQILRTDKVNSISLVVHFTKASGKMTKEMVMGSSSGQMETPIMGTTGMILNTGRDSSDGQMEGYMMGNS